MSGMHGFGVGSIFLLGFHYQIAHGHEGGIYACTPHTVLPWVDSGSPPWTQSENAVISNSLMLQTFLWLSRKMRPWSMSLCFLKGFISLLWPRWPHNKHADPASQQPSRALFSKLTLASRIPFQSVSASNPLTGDMGAALTGSRVCGVSICNYLPGYMQPEARLQGWKEGGSGCWWASVMTRNDYREEGDQLPS